MEDGHLNSKVGFIIQARMKSSRLPGKILMPLPLGGKTLLLGWITNALKSSKYYQSIYVATSTNPENDGLLKFTQQNEVNFFRGSEDDVFSRFNSIVRDNDFDTIVRFTGDNPIIDIPALDNSIEFHLTSGAQYTTTKFLPLGMNFEIIDVESFKSIKYRDLTPEDKEHVTLYMRNSGKFKINEYKPESTNGYNNLRLTVDYPSDFLVVSSVISIGEKINMKPCLSLVDYCIKNYPWLFDVNKDNHQKSDYKNLQEEWIVAKPMLERFEFKRLISVINDKV